MKSEIAHDARAEFLEGTNDTGILIIHGFTGSTQSMRPIAYALNKLGYTINMPRLKGHGTTPEDMETTDYKDWTNSVKIAYDELKPEVEKLFVLGLSMGGTLALYTALNFRIDGVITVNAAANNLNNFKKMYENENLPRFIDGIGSDIKKEGVKEWAYSKTPKKCINDLLELCRIVTKDIAKIICPILIFKSPEDHVVPADNQDFIFNNAGSENKELVELKNSYHVATLDNDQNTIINKTHKFILENI